MEKSSQKHKKPLTVMQLLPELNSGGVERGTLELGRFLVEDGHKSIVVSGGGRLVKTLIDEGSEHITLKIGSKSPIALYCVWPLRRAILKHQVDVLHLRSRVPAWVGYLVLKTLPKKKRPLLMTTFHGFHSVNRYSAIMAKGTGVIAVSQSIKDHILEKYNRQHDVRLIFRGVDIGAFDQEKIDHKRIQDIADAWQLDREKKVLMLPGRLTRLKGHQVFLESLTRVQNTKYQAVIVGDAEDNPGYTKELLDYIQKNEIGDRVKLVGHCTDMPAAFSLADIVLSTSSSEPEAFGRTSVEAMAMGKPVIATAHGGSLETVVPDQTGWLIAPGSSDELAGAIDNALTCDNELLQQFGESGRQRVKENFTTRAMCEKTLAFYHELLGRDY